MRNPYTCIWYSILISICFLFPLSAYSQHSKIDSMWSVLKTEKEDTERVNTLNNLSRALYNKGMYGRTDSTAQAAIVLAKKLDFKRGMGDANVYFGLVYCAHGKYDTALYYQRKALEIYESIGYKTGEANAYGNMGIIYSSQGKYPEALKVQSEALKINTEIGNKLGLGGTYGNIGIIYYNEANYPEALKNQLASLKIKEEMGNKQGMGIAYLNIANIYDAQNEYDDGLTYLLKALAIFKELNMKYGLGTAYGNIGNVYFHKGNYAEALNNQYQSLKICGDIGNKYGMGLAYSNVGSIYYARFLQQKKDNSKGADSLAEKAAESFAKSLKIYEQIGDQHGIGSVYGQTGSLYVQQKKYGLAKSYLDSSLNLAKSIGSNDIIKDAYLYMTFLDSAEGKYNEAYENYKNYIIYNDSLKNAENTKKMVSEEMQYEFDKTQAKEKAEQDQKDAITLADKRKQQIITASVSIGLLLLLVFSGMLFSRFKVTQRQKKIIEEQKQMVEEKNKEVLDSITYAKRLQDAILPPMSIIKKYFPESFVLYKPKDIVAGDFYWLEKSGDTILIAACDCTGHGVPGAMVSVVCSNALNRTVKEFKITEPGKILDKVRELVLETFEKSEGEVKDGMDCSFCAINTKTNKIEWSGAYNSLWYIENGELKELNADKQPIGKTDNPKAFTTHSITLPNGEGQGGALYLFTDGYADQFGGPKGKKFKYKQLQQLVTDNAKLPMEEQGNLLNETLEAWKGNLEQVDDVLIIGIRV